MPRIIPTREALGRHPAALLGSALGLAWAWPAAARPPQASPGPEARAAAAALRADWAQFKARFLAEEGRVVDTGNGGISHSEGQGFAMLVAERLGDRAAFERLLGWTRRELRRPEDALHAWRYRPGVAVPVDDPNNATDGDLCIAWALLRAGARWGEPAHTEAGRRIARDILRLLVRQAGPYTVLLPGAAGFDTPEAVVVNPSYYAFPALAALSRAVPDPLWKRVTADGLRLLRAAAFGRWGLPPDWLQLDPADGAASLPSAWPPRFSYDAVRVPLWLAWARLLDEPALARAAGFFADPAHPHAPAWADLATDAISPYPATAGLLAIARLAQAGRGCPGEGAGPPPPPPPGGTAPDYYAAVLVLLARMAGLEGESLPNH